MTFAPDTAEFEAALLSAQHAGLTWLAARRQAERDRFISLGIPGRRSELWRWTDLRPLNDLAFKPREGSSQTLVDFGGACIEIIDGKATTKTPAGPVNLMSFAQAMQSAPNLLEQHYGYPVESAAGLGALNVALSMDGAVVHVPANLSASQIVHLDFRNNGQDAARHTRSLIVVEAGASLSLVETHAGPDGCQYFAHPGFDIVLGDGARLVHYRLEHEGDQSVQLADTRISLGSKARYENVALSAGGRLVRNDIGLRFTGTGASARLISTYLAAGQRHVDTTSLIDHLMPECTSEQIAKGVVAGRGRGVFQGKIIVRPGAQKTDARQLTKALVLSEQAEIDHKPELEIYADDVSCAHGATAGDLDEQALFYLESRGIPRAEARLMLVRAFLVDALEHIDVASVRAHFELVLERQLAAIGDAGL
jgi:Fe-S cluster assembly protein SufD